MRRCLRRLRRFSLGIGRCSLEAQSETLDLTCEVNHRVRPSDEYMDNITTRIEQYRRPAPPLAEFVQLGRDSTTTVRLLLDMEKTFDIRFSRRHAG